MPLTLSPITYVVTCCPNILDILEPLEYVLPTIELESIVTDFNLEQPLKALSPMLVTLLPIVTEVKLVQPLKSPSPMLVTLFGIVTEVKLVQP